LTASALDVTPNLGVQQPRLEWIPAGHPHPDQAAALEFGVAAGFGLQQWQEYVGENSLLEKRPGKWASFENALIVPRQNGKTELAIWRMLAGALILGERLVVYTAHLAKTSEEVFRRTREKVDEVDWLSHEVKHTWRANGREAIEFRSGARILFQTRTPSSGRGFAKADCVILDEAMYLPASMIASILYILGRADNPQLWYLGSSPDQVTQPDSIALAALRERGLKGDDESLAFFEWSIPGFTTPQEVPAEVLKDQANWAIANPALGYGLPHEQVANEYRSSQHLLRLFAIERGGIGDWPSTSEGEAVISLEQWQKLTDGSSKPVDPVVFAFDVSPDRGRAAISVAGKRSDGLSHVETVDWRDGTGWIVDRLVELAEKHRPAALVCDERSPAAALIPDLEARNLEIRVVNTSEHAKACGIFYDMAYQGRLRHLGTPELASALRGAAKRDLSDSWAWSRKNSQVDISPLVAATLALWGSTTAERPKVVGVAFA
jgi:hypothetical protein